MDTVGHVLTMLFVLFFVAMLARMVLIQYRASGEPGSEVILLFPGVRAFQGMHIIAANSRDVTVEVEELPAYTPPPSIHDGDCHSERPPSFASHHIDIQPSYEVLAVPPDAPATSDPPHPPPTSLPSAFSKATPHYLSILNPRAKMEYRQRPNLVFPSNVSRQQTISVPLLSSGSLPRIPGTRANGSFRAKSSSYYVPQSLYKSNGSIPFNIINTRTHAPPSAESVIDLEVLPENVTAHSWKDHDNFVYFADWKTKRCSWVDPRTLPDYNQHAHRIQDVTDASASSIALYENWASDPAIRPVDHRTDAYKTAIEMSEEYKAAMEETEEKIRDIRREYGLPTSRFGLHDNHTDGFAVPATGASLREFKSEIEKTEEEIRQLRSGSGLDIGGVNAIEKGETVIRKIRRELALDIDDSHATTDPSAQLALLDEQEAALLKRENSMLAADLQAYRQQLALLMEINAALDAKEQKWLNLGHQM
ncbi:hypothetical protein DFJ77DRAFT_516212 [Powellomyces hirtus]|nr:hypothetical protein DFJ77DRAFT_516212 [Powellomyces hirtus]